MHRQSLAIALLALMVNGFWQIDNLVWAQPALDRVLNRVGQEVDRALQQANQPQQPPAADQGDDPLPDAEPGYLGLIADDRTEQGQGVRVTGVLPGTPAANAKLAVNDMIMAINGRPIRTLDEMARILSTFAAGARVTFSVMRDGLPTTVPVTLGQRPGANARPFANFGAQPEAVAATAAERPKLGVRTVPVTEQTKVRQGLPSTAGAVVIAVAAGSVAEQAGIRLGSVITQINGFAVTSPDQLVELVNQAAATGMLKIAYVQDGQEITQEVPFGAAAVVANKPAEEPVPAGEPAEDLTELEAYLDALERRVQQLEDRVATLEQALAEKNAAGNAKAELQDEADLDAATDEAAKEE